MIGGSAYIVDGALILSLLWVVSGCCLFCRIRLDWSSFCDFGKEGKVECGWFVEE